MVDSDHYLCRETVPGDHKLEFQAGQGQISLFEMIPADARPRALVPETLPAGLAACTVNHSGFAAHPGHQNPRTPLLSYARRPTLASVSACRPASLGVQKWGITVQPGGNYLPTQPGDVIFRWQAPAWRAVEQKPW